MARRTIRSYPDFANMYRWLAASLGQLGRTEEAREALQKAISMAPRSFDLHVRSRPPWMPRKEHAHMLEGLRKGRDAPLADRRTKPTGLADTGHLAAYGGRPDQQPVVAVLSTV